MCDTATHILQRYFITGAMISNLPVKYTWRYGSHQSVPNPTLHFITAKPTSIGVNTLRSRKMDAISQTTHSNAFSGIKMFQFRLKFHWSLFQRVNILALVQIMAWRLFGIYASLGLNEWHGYTITFTKNSGVYLLIHALSSAVFS